jgi:GNAT superfamily N-acetyltransferase
MSPPFVLQAMLDVPPKKQPERTETLTDDLPAVFGDLNWDHCENGSACPVPSEGVSTLMGPATSARAGFGSKYDDDLVATAILCAAHCLRAAGYAMQIVPDDYEAEAPEEANDKHESTKKRQKKDVEFDYLTGTEYYDEPIAVYKKSADKNTNTGNEKPVAHVSTASTDKPWLVVDCTTPEITASVQSLLAQDFALLELKHETSILAHSFDDIADDDCINEYSITTTTGTKQGDDEDGGSVSTIFVLKRKDKVVAKALCTYSNGEMDSVGPTLELLEVAQEWRRHGLGLALMEAVEGFHRNLCEPIVERGHRVLFAVCYVTNAYVSTWFQEQCDFEDLDGMGEELGKYL